jgi:hypothetical protein
MPSDTSRKATPAGFEGGPGSANLGEDRPSSTESDTSETFSKSLAEVTGSKVARLSRVGQNALRNRDLHRAMEVLMEIEEVVSGAGACPGWWGEAIPLK